MKILEIDCKTAIEIANEKIANHGWINSVDELMLEEHIAGCSTCSDNLNPKLYKYKD